MIRKELTLSDAAIIKELSPSDRKILNVGCGGCRLDDHLLRMGYDVYSADFQSNEGWLSRYQEEINVRESKINYFGSCNILDSDTFNFDHANVVISSQVLEHLSEYKKAFKNLLKLGEKIVITIPHLKSFNPGVKAPIGHCNFWNDNGTNGYKNVLEFIEMASPYHVTIKKAMTKVKDFDSQRIYVIVVDKSRKMDFYINNIEDIAQKQLEWDEKYLT